jgi:5-methylcytosine-specific restriction endonuclease McrA
MIKKCDVCHQKFEGHGNALRCSDACKREARAARDHERYVANRVVIAARDHERYVANREARLARHREYREANRAALLARQREYYAETRGARLAKQSEYREANRGAIAARKREYYRTPRGRALYAAANARHRGAACRASDPAYTLLCSCQVCGATDDLQLEHMVPVSQGGTHYLENLTTMCRACNMSKWVKGPHDFAIFLRWFLDRRAEMA